MDLKSQMQFLQQSWDEGWYIWVNQGIYELCKRDLSFSTLLTISSSESPLK